MQHTHVYTGKRPKTVWWEWKIDDANVDVDVDVDDDDDDDDDYRLPNANGLKPNHVCPYFQRALLQMARYSLLPFNPSIQLLQRGGVPFNWGLP